MKILKIKNLAGPNVWANFPVLEVWIDLEEFRDSPSDVLPGFNERLMNWLPSMIEHRCSEGVRGGFFERLRRGTWLGHILEHTTLELQTLAGNEVGFGRARETSTEGIYRVAIEYKQQEVARAAVDTAFRMLLAAIHDTPFDVDGEIEKLKEVIEDTCLGPSTRSIVDAAEKRGIPWRRLTSGSLIRFGHGINQHKIQAAETDHTSAIAESIAQDKELTRQLLKEAGIPVPEGGPVESLEEALSDAAYIGGPVVVKPRYGNQGRGVSANLTTPDQITEAYHIAREISRNIIVEQFITGFDFRVLIVGGRMVAAARREPAHVIGDGKHSVQQLVDLVNADPRRGNGHGSSLTKITIDEAVVSLLASQGLTVESVPATNRKILLRRNANLSTGGTAVDITDQVHPEFAARCIEAAKVVGLDIAGIDVLALDPSKPLTPSNGAIVEVNAAPGLRMHLDPSEGTPRPVGEAILDLMFKPGETGRIPLAAVTGVNGKTTVTRLIAHVLKTQGLRVGMTCTDGIWLDDRRIDSGDCSGPASARAVLAHPEVQAAVLETARGGILRAGLGFDRCQVAVVTNIGEGDHLGIDGIDTLEKLALVKRTIVDVVLPDGMAILNGADPLVIPMAAKSPGGSLFFAISEHEPALAAHRAHGKPVIFVRDGVMVLFDGKQEISIDRVSEIPLTIQGRIKFQVENVLASAAALWGMGVSVEQIRRGLRTFQSDVKQSPGRFNVLEINSATVIVDYGHNPSALDALISAAESFPAQRRIAVYSTAGDRRDCDIQRQGEQLGNSFDEVYLFEGHYKRGRQDGEMISLFQSGVQRGTRVRKTWTSDDALASAEMALNDLEPGDLLLLQADTVDETLEFLRNYLAKQLEEQKSAAHEAIHSSNSGRQDAGSLVGSGSTSGGSGSAHVGSLVAMAPQSSFPV